jgi:hypothetical protein
MYSQTISYFHKKKITYDESIHLKPVFNLNSYEIFQFLDKKDLESLKITNKYFFELCECHNLFTESIKGLQGLFLNSILAEENTKKAIQKEKKSKFKEKFNFNKSMNEFYKGSDILNERLLSGRKKK